MRNFGLALVLFGLTSIGCGDNAPSTDDGDTVDMMGTDSIPTGPDLYKAPDLTGGCQAGGCGGNLLVCPNSPAPDHCIDPRSDHDNCGCCDVICGANQTCLNSVCTDIAGCQPHDPALQDDVPAGMTFETFTCVAKATAKGWWIYGDDGPIAERSVWDLTGDGCQAFGIMMMMDSLTLSTDWVCAQPLDCFQDCQSKTNTNCFRLTFGQDCKTLTVRRYAQGKDPMKDPADAEVCTGEQAI
ncbi:MAG: hypothetical protein Q7R83_01125 [bacterium]|nr:hypothetical protein [bacterium]